MRLPVTSTFGLTWSATWRASARLIARKAVGLVFAGGGARGFAHLGIWRALQEQGVEIDYMGGTSIGAVLAALIAADPPVKRSDRRRA